MRTPTARSARTSTFRGLSTRVSMARMVGTAAIRAPATISLPVTEIRKGTDTSSRRRPASPSGR